MFGVRGSGFGVRGSGFVVVGSWPPTSDPFCSLRGPRFVAPRLPPNPHQPLIDAQARKVLQLRFYAGFGESARPWPGAFIPRWSHVATRASSAGNLPGDELIFPENPVQWIFRIFALALAITVHELSHAWSAYKLGDPTAKQMGRVSLNPLAHYDLIGTTMILLFGFGWGKPVPVNPLNFRHPGRDNALVSLAGPASNFACAILFGLAFRVILAAGGHGVESHFLFSAGILTQEIVILSLILGVFNLIPIPPLDGSHILREFLPRRMQAGFDTFATFAPFVLMLVLVLLVSTPIVSLVVWPAVIVLYRIITGT